MKTTPLLLALMVGLAPFAAPSAASAQAQVRVYDHASGQWISGDRARIRTETVQRKTQMMKKPDARFARQSVRIATKEKPGTIVIDTDRKFLYFVEGNGMATRYGVGVGKEGFSWGGTMSIGRKAEWPGWTPPAAMRVREKAKGRILPAYMPGGPENPLGARAMYLYRGGGDSMFRIHGTNQPWTIGLNMSSGCIRMMNDDVAHLYERAKRGTKVVVIGPGQPNRLVQETGTVRPAGRKPGLFAGVFG
ncbi:L,D-transpeptidase [Aureimonas phyllosphaerae]|uniref:Lipoprotein-anchoring transpeptidase ErfK/SrfK n=2 Tax=Aureimonas TaxID=414371 RepID=A0A7W6FV61_9HYPH|nr:L,D-transpeptidase [Aureimonas phyllosphaerae]MBB3936811.1 lipoprotein-anchoring transpeptidase ErfK/SrfK [Aureimonas phyllosphaerae]MBB3961074.1 lipoprotein-anchoring transpeptidase ErfK/SrfK [Aureimonas phyllosphaerae]SFF26160.1 Lipoprotein-anchoring transpeptidase ErfK/SrfK [Aureimonas phyllosphaerae]